MSPFKPKPAYKPYIPKQHPREEDIKKAQPPMNKGIQGTGNGKERTHGYGRGA